MHAPPAVTFSPRRARGTRARHGLHLAGPSSGAMAPLALDGVAAVEIVAPDRHSAMLLAEFAAPAFAVELVPGSPWVVRFRQPPVAGDWVVDLLALVERWLAATPLPCAKLLTGGRSYLIRGPLDAA